jgi:hypothetical protein
MRCPKFLGLVFLSALVAATGTTCGRSESDRPGCPCRLPEGLTIVPADTFRITRDIDDDGVADRGGYTRERPWHTVQMQLSKCNLQWSAQPGVGLERVFTPWNRELRARVFAHLPDSVEAQRTFDRYEIRPRNVEHAPVLLLGGRLVVMWFMEPLYPAGINTYDACGNLLSRYVHPGHLRAIIPAGLRGRRWVIFGGTNNLLDAEAAKREERKPLNLPVVGAIPLGTNGVHPGMRLRVEAGTALVSMDFPYWIADRDRNSQVIHLHLTEDEWLEGIYEPGRTRDGRMAPEPGRFRIPLDSLWAARDTVVR